MLTLTSPYSIKENDLVIVPHYIGTAPNMWVVIEANILYCELINKVTKDEYYCLLTDLEPLQDE